MQTVQYRPFSFLGQSKSGRIFLLATSTLAGSLTGCSTADHAQATAPASSLAAQDAYASAVAPQGVMSMAAGDRLGMAVYTQDYELARAGNSGSSRFARNTNQSSRPQPTVASVPTGD